LAYARLIAERLWPNGRPPQLLPRWPDGHKYAVIMTHDVDRPERASLGRALFREVLGPRSLTRRQAWYALRAEIRSYGIIQSLLAGPTRRREWDFEKLCALEDAHSIRSAFYFAVVHRSVGHSCDVDYHLDLPRYLRLFKKLQSRGFEVGLHAGYSTRWGWPPISQQAAHLSQLRRETTRGVRHHYLQVNHDDPMQSLFEHADAGLLYDSSIGFNDAPGYRAGTALPYSPFHATRGTASGFVELPMTLADMHLPTRDESTAVETVRHHLDNARRLGGMAVLNWHVGHWHRDPAWRAAFIAACEFVGNDPTAWTPTPAQAAQWWMDRQARLQDESANRPAPELILDLPVVRRMPISTPYTARPPLVAGVLLDSSRTRRPTTPPWSVEKSMERIPLQDQNHD